MPIDDEALAAHIEKHGPVLFHVTDAKHHEAIMRDGLRPGSELGCFMRDDFSARVPGMSTSAIAAEGPSSARTHRCVREVCRRSAPSPS